MQGLGRNFLLFGSFMLNPRAFLNRLGKQFGKCGFQLKPKLRVKQNPCCVSLTVACKGTPWDHGWCSGGRLSLAGNLNSESPQKTEGSWRKEREKMSEHCQHYGKHCPGICAWLGEQQQPEPGLCWELWGETVLRQLCSFCTWAVTLDWSLLLLLQLAPTLGALFWAGGQPRMIHTVPACSAAPWLIAGTAIATATKSIPQWRLQRGISVLCSCKGSVEAQVWSRIPPWCALCVQWGKGDDQRRWWSRILFLCLS